MIHVRAMKVPRGNKPGPLYGYYASSGGFGPPNATEQIRRAVVMATVASVLVLVGSLLTWLVYTEVFGSKVPIMGPLVISLGVLLVVLSVRQFFVVWQQKKNPPAKKDTAPAEDEEMPCDCLLEMETWDGEKPSYLQNYRRAPSYDSSGNFKSMLPPPPPSCILLPNSTGGRGIIPYYQPFTPVPVPYYQPRTDLPLHPHPPPPPLTPSPDATATTTTIMTVTGVNADGTPKVKSCFDLSAMTRSGSMEAPNPRPVIRYSQGQLELLDKEAAAMGCTSPTLLASPHSRTSLGDRSISPNERVSHKSLSLSIERTDILETI